MNPLINLWGHWAFRSCRSDKEARRFEPFHSLQAPKTRFLVETDVIVILVSNCLVICRVPAHTVMNGGAERAVERGESAAGRMERKKN